MSSLHHALARYGITPSELNSLLAAKVDKNTLALDVHDHNVTGDGSTDDTEALQDAIDSAYAAGIDTYLPPGSYVITSDLYIKGRVYGCGPSSIILATAGIRMNTAGGKLENVKVMSSESYAITAANTSKITVRDVEVLQDSTAISGGATVGFQGYNTNRIKLIGNTMNFSGFELSQSDNFLIKDNYWDCNYQNIDEPTHVSRGSRGQYIDNVVYRSTSDCLDLYSDGGWTVVQGNRFLSPRLTGSNGCVMEVKTVWTDNPSNSSTHDYMQNSTIIANNIIKDAQISTGTGVRTGISAFYLDSRATPAFTTAETAVGMQITGNTLEGFQLTESIGANWIGIGFTGHNSIISNNIIRNMHGYSTAPQYGIYMAEPLNNGVSSGVKCTGVKVINNVIAGIGGNPGRGMYFGNLEKCEIDGNTIRTDEWSGETTKYGIDFAAGAQVNNCSISNNNIQCNISSSFAIRANDVTTKLNRCKMNSNNITDCGVLLKWIEYCQFNNNSFNNPTNGQGITFGDAGTSSLGTIINGNQFVMNNNNCVLLINMNGFTANNNIFKAVARPFYAFNNTKNGVVTGNVSVTQGNGSSVVLFDGTVSTADQGSIFVDNNSIVNSSVSYLANKIAINVKDYGARGDGVADDTTAIQAAFTFGIAIGCKKFVFPSGNYVVSSLADGAAFVTFTNKTGITIDAANATITNPTSYVTDSITAMFLFDNCKDVSITVGHYIGYTLPSPTSHLGYRGSTLVRLINGCDGATIDARITNARYGVQSGEYADQTKGYNKNMDIRLRTSFCGYPVALYLAEGVRFDIDSDDIHRSAYLAGCVDVTGITRWKNQYIADVVVLVTDAKTGTGTSRGCSNLDITSIDKGSTIFQSSSSCTGIGLSRVDPGILYENIKLRNEVIGTDTLSTQVGAFKLYSGAKDLTTPPAAYNWEPSIIIRNVSISGVVDHSAATLTGNTAGDIFVRAYDTLIAHSATIENLSFEDLIIKQSSGNTRALYLEAPGIINGGITFRNMQAHNATLNILTSPSIPTTFTNCTLSTLDTSGVTGGSRVILNRCTLGALIGVTGDNTNTDTISSSIGGAGGFIRHKQVTLNLSGSTTSWSNAIPTGALLLGVQTIIKTNITGSTGLQIGVSGDATRYLNTNTTAANSTFGVANYATAETTPRYYTSTTDLVATSKTSSFTGGQIRVAITYMIFTAPTS